MRADSASDGSVDAAVAALLDTLSTISAPVVRVSPEVGQGIVPETRLGRRFRDAQGTLNRRVAEVVAKVVFVAAGQPLVLKPAPKQELSL